MGNSMKRVKLSSLKANPYRDIDNYPLNETKVEKLIESFEKTGFWGNIVCRKVTKGYEIAFGHHRLEALRRHYGDNAMIDVVIREASNSDMLRMMADENMEEWGTSAWHELETIKMTVQAFANGEIEFEEAKGRKDQMRCAPRFVPGDLGAEPAPKSYTMLQVAEFLGWTKSKGNRREPDLKCRTAFAALELGERGVIVPNDLQGLTRNQCQNAIQQARKTFEYHMKKQREAEKKLAVAEKAVEVAKTPAQKRKAKTAVDIVKDAKEQHGKAAKSSTKKVVKDVAKSLKKGDGVRGASKVAQKTRNSLMPESTIPSVSEHVSKIRTSLRNILGMKRKGGEYVNPAVDAIHAIIAFAGMTEDVTSEHFQSIVDDLEDVKNRCDELISKLESAQPKAQKPRPQKGQRRISE